MNPYTQKAGLINKTSHPPNLNQILLWASQPNTLNRPLELLPPLSRQRGGGHGAGGMRGHHPSDVLPCWHPALQQGGGDRLSPRLAHHLPLGERGKASSQRGSVGSTGPAAGLDTPCGVCHPGTWETGSTEALAQVREKPAARAILGRR